MPTRQSFDTVSSVSTITRAKEDATKPQVSTASIAPSSSASSTKGHSETRDIGKRAWRKVAQMAREHHESVTAATSLYYDVGTGYATPRRSEAKS
ncbi:uncharacterized protein J7T54_000441 [Emericellopsis cladophorae]|uniref:Uncharacterized protein n=1 Tax=Emericellopsis cladophorae TaxID=2686198 RepID=A0A9P9XXG0_9HYPO|nr:uncharacterized protein J7T54_000441 [Emericellopsis cladophorae]KAI6779343.1 hypothetical protein J7T54_000441 [Emericellopsis cladophorae]